MVYLIVDLNMGTFFQFSMRTTGVTLGKQFLIKKVLVPLAMTIASRIIFEQYLSTQADKKLAQDTIKETILVTTGVASTQILFHYIDPVSAREIVGDQFIFATPVWPNKKPTRPAGACAVDQCMLHGLI